MINLQKLALTTFMVSSITIFACKGQCNPSHDYSGGSTPSIDSQTIGFEILRGQFTAFVTSTQLLKRAGATDNFAKQIKDLLIPACSSLYEKEYPEKIIALAKKLEESHIITNAEYKQLIVMIKDDEDASDNND
jgi:hypothetical protein